MNDPGNWKGKGGRGLGREKRQPAAERATSRVNQDQLPLEGVNQGTGVKLKRRRRLIVYMMT